MLRASHPSPADCAPRSAMCTLQVTAGTVLFEAPITMRATSTGAGSTLSGIGRLVAAAQAREAPVQRLADTIAGRFCYTVIGASAATFAFWSLAGAVPLTGLLLILSRRAASTFRMPVYWIWYVFNPESIILSKTSHQSCLQA